MRGQMITGFNPCRQSAGRVSLGFALMMVSAFIFLCAPSDMMAAPFAQYFQFIQPDGTRLVLWGEGDEFYAVFETTSGYTVIFDPRQREYFYAARAADGKSLISTGVPAHAQAPPALRPHIRVDSDAVIAAARARQRQWDADTGLSRRWAQLKAQTLGTPLLPGEAGPTPAPPGTTTTGTKVGLTLLIDFSDAPATVSQTEIDSFLNGDSYTGFGNNGSVKKYFSDVSASRLTYTNVVTIYIRMTQPKSYYNDTSKDAGAQARILINDALAILKARSDYSSTILPTFESLTTDAYNCVLAFNVYFAGSNSGVWAYGLWPHSWSLLNSVPLGNGKSVYRYQITDIGSSLVLGTFCHENGHMLCGFPDIYDYDYDSVGGAGAFCLMNSGGHGTNPSQVCAYLKLAAGWATTIDLNSTSDLTGTVVAAPNSGYDQFYRYKRPGITTEYFLVENRQKTGRDSGLPGAGVAVWHIDELGSRDNQNMVPNANHQNYEVTLIQADNLWHFENNVNSGDSRDLYYQGNSAAGYSNSLNDSSAPHAHWWDGSSSGMSLSTFSSSGMTMTFKVGGGGGGLPAPVLTAEPAVTPGTTNTIYWSAVSSIQFTSVSTQSAVTHRAAPLSLIPAAHTSGLPTRMPAIAKERSSPDGMTAKDGPVPARAILNLERVFTSPGNNGKIPAAAGPLASTTLFSETFEGAFPGTSWTLSGSPTWNSTNYDKYGGSWSAWCAGSTQSPANGYIDNMDAWMVYGPFSLAGATSANVNFYYKNLSESEYDYFQWLASVDGTYFYGQEISGDQNTWRSQVFDLSNVYYLGDLRGQTQVWIAFRFLSDGGVSGPTYTGAYVDNVTITADFTPTADLAVYKPSNWNYSIPVGTTQLGGTAAHSEAGPYYDNQTLYYNWASANLGTATATGYKIHVEVTGTGGGSWDWSGLTTDPAYYTYLLMDQAFGPLSAGSHTIKIWLDYDGTVSESNESNNYYERTITVSAAVQTEYYAECAGSPSFSSPANSGWIQQTQYTFNNLTPGQTYWYRVKARRGTTESGWSNVEFSQQEGSSTFTLTVTKNGTGSGTVTSSPAGITCGSTCQASFSNNQQVILTAVATSPATFSGWSGEGCSGTGTCTVTMSQARSVTATFTAKKVRGQLVSY